MEAEGDVLPLTKQNDEPHTISRAAWKGDDRRMCHANRRSISDQDECNLPAGRCQAATYPARKKQADLSCIHLKLSDVFLWCICLYLTIVTTVRRTTEMGLIKRHRSTCLQSPLPFTGMMVPQKEARKSKPSALYRDDESSEFRSAKYKTF